MFSACQTPKFGYSSESEYRISTTKANSVALPREVLDQLTKFLRMEPSIEITTPDESWLDQQEARLEGLGAPLRPSNGLIKQLISRVNYYRHPTRFAHLCSSHRSLNPHIIRYIMLLIVSELTKRTNRFRSWRSRITFPGCIIAWLDRIDAATALWIGRDAFFAMFGYNQPDMAVQSVASGCEACILGIVGGRPQLLIDLRASMLARYDHYPNHTHIEPRLWCFVESWVTQFDDDVRRGIVAASVVLAEQMTKLKPMIEEEETKGSRKGSGKGSSMKRFLTPTSLDPWHDDIDETDNETWGWMDKRMQARGLTPKQSREMLRDVHLAISDCAPPSATPDRLAVGKTSVDKTMSAKNSFQNGMRGSVRGSQRSSWVTMTVHSDDEENNQTSESEPTTVRPMSEITEFPSASAETGRQQTHDGEAHGVEQFEPARRHWNKPEPSINQTRFPGPPASSIYSSHPGFRHSQTPLAGRTPSIRPPRAPYYSRPLLCSGLETHRPSTSRFSRAALANSPPAAPSSSHPGFQRSADNKFIDSQAPYPDPPGGWI